MHTQSKNIDEVSGQNLELARIGIFKEAFVLYPQVPKFHLLVQSMINRLAQFVYMYILRGKKQHLLKDIRRNESVNYKFRFVWNLLKYIV